MKAAVDTIQIRPACALTLVAAAAAICAPAAEVFVTKALARPAVCAGLTPHECSARVGGE